MSRPDIDPRNNLGGTIKLNVYRDDSTWLETNTNRNYRLRPMALDEQEFLHAHAPGGEYLAPWIIGGGSEGPLDGEEHYAPLAIAWRTGKRTAQKFLIIAPEGVTAALLNQYVDDDDALSVIWRERISVEKILQNFTMPLPDMVELIQNAQKQRYWTHCVQPPHE